MDGVGISQQVSTPHKLTTNGSAILSSICKSDQQWQGPTIINTFCVSHLPSKTENNNACECKKNNSHETVNQVYLKRTFQIIPEFGICYILQLWTQFVWNNVSHTLRCIIYTLYKYKLIWTTNTITIGFKSRLRMTTLLFFKKKYMTEEK